MLCPMFAVVLVVGLGPLLVGAFPLDAPKKTCRLSQYGYPASSELMAVGKFKEYFESIMPPTDRKCSTRLFHRKWKPNELSVPDRLLLAEAELDLTVTVLAHPTIHRLAEMSQQPLAFLTQALEDLRGCVATEAPSHHPSGKLRHWLQKLETAKKTETANCLEFSTILNLFHVLNDLRCAAIPEQCT
ncbi:interferon lambda-3-like [Oxyura jamaicensis]|uniref:interferon lambda-3-like n=1 Tax=Oxyura jamaicensis TaxID=8884 RepID=UPI0015A5E5C3|nr:interferon lambda-3-like [Oxyura jamaicensis]